LAKSLIILLLALLMPLPLLAVNGTITAVATGTLGWDAYISISGFTDLGTIAMGMGTNNNPSTAKVVFTVSSSGYTQTGSTTTVTRTVYGTIVVRLPYPNAWVASTSYALNNAVSDGTNTQKVIACSGTCTSGTTHCTWATTPGNTCVDNSGANQITWEDMGNLPAEGTTSGPPGAGSPDENISVGGTMTLRVALSEYIYTGDTVTMTAASGFYNDSKTGGTGINNLAVTNIAVTNNSTLAYSSIKPICRNGWPGYERVTGPFPVEALCFSHFAQKAGGGLGGGEVAAVTFTATDQHSNSVSVTVSAMGKSYWSPAWTNPSVPYASGGGDTNPVLGYGAVIPTSTFTQGDQITVYSPNLAMRP
jgi:hypothetical protein